ncbi:CoxG family protein [Streptomyces sp. SBT349]|uniref:CoxG family protein n=1 Tax=Streptomyces sp. SBT349 TaxID=1580539 RepID=UPI00066ACCCB|nr:SRPBCC domain-containing protein [Streptomyces sp. SBT349]
MKLSSQFTVPAEPEQVFTLFLDADVMRDSIPGCTELVRVNDETYRGRLQNVIAHVRFNAGFTARIVSIDTPRQVDALLQGEDRKLGSSIKIDARLSVRPDPAGSLVGYQMEMALWGKIGRLGEAIVRRRSVEMERQFVERFGAACAADAVSHAAGAPGGAEAIAAGAVTAEATAADAAMANVVAADTVTADGATADGATADTAGTTHATTAATGAAHVPGGRTGRPTRQPGRGWWRRLRGRGDDRGSRPRGSKPRSGWWQRLLGRGDDRGSR